MFKMKNGVRIALFVAAATLAMPANAAAITYLECTMSKGGGEDAVWKIALDETAKTVSFEHFAASGIERAIFTADKVTWSDGRMVISRVDLTFSRTSLGHTDVGKCKVVNPPKRAF
jgi:hypothetical protein